VEEFPPRAAQLGEELLRVENLTGNGTQDINFTLHTGEILGFAGLVGAGRTEIMNVIYGASKCDSGAIYIQGQKVRIQSPIDAIKNGIGLIPEDRKRTGLFLFQSIAWNSVITALRSICKFGVVNTKKEKEITQFYKDKLHIKTPSLDIPVMSLSGGNQQKVVIAKTLAANSKIIIFDEPTRGIDVGAKQEIYQLMNELAESGHAILMISSEMPELLGMSDRVVVICEGKQNGIVEKSDFSQAHILDLASGEN
nr:sugar ABC transporter ATP-binding protein [Oscillospiraceae bacterium]